MQTETDKIGFSLFFYYKTIDTFSLDNQFYFHIQKLKTKIYYHNGKKAIDIKFQSRSTFEINKMINFRIYFES